MWMFQAHGSWFLNKSDQAFGLRVLGSTSHGFELCRHLDLKVSGLGFRIQGLGFVWAHGHGSIIQRKCQLCSYQTCSDYMIFVMSVFVGLRLELQTRVLLASNFDSKEFGSGFKEGSHYILHHTNAG